MPNIGDAWTRYSQGDLRGAAELARRLFGSNPNDASALTCAAVSEWELGGDVAKAIADLERAVALAPNESWILHNVGTLLASAGRLEEARATYLKAIALKPFDTQAFYGLSQNMRFTEETGIVRQMLDIYSSGELTPKEQEFICFGLAKAFSDLKQYKQAMHFCIEGNWLAHRAYDAAVPRTELDELRRMVSSDAFRAIPAGTPSLAARPVFIVGMPRSGTTLMETILSRHGEVYAGGEMQHIVDVEKALMGWARQQGFAGGSYELLRQVPQEFYTRNAEAVLSRVQRSAGQQNFTVFTDKLPDNSLRLGLISKLFPDARIIHMRRHPLDCCISVLFLHFRRGNGYAYRQSLLGERYRQVAEAMNLWKSTLDLPILDVSYEMLVSDPETNIRRIVDFCGLEWDPDCLTPERSERIVGSANQFQVRQPINRASIGRWRNYEEWIQPLIKALGGLEWIEAEQRDSGLLAA